ncbi:MAG TPA: c-type cytochrome [Burkholderiales bacterium]|jgi:mono/diheme cytochrome c family protein
MRHIHAAIAGTLAFALLQSFMVADARAEDQRLARGRYLMSSLAACGNCHTPRGPDGATQWDRELSGGPPVKDAAFDAFPPNITTDTKAGIGRWTNAQLKRAIREGIRPDGSLIGPPMPFGFYRDMADSDLEAIIAYLRQVKPNSNTPPRSVYHIPLPPSYGPPIKQAIKAPARSDTLAYGAYLAGPVAHCMECHTPMVKGQTDRSKMGAGGNAFNGPWGTSVARNLTPHESGLKNWSDAEIEKAVREGVSRDGSRLKPPMAFDYYKSMKPEDMKAIIAYLRSLPPTPTGGL